MRLTGDLKERVEKAGSVEEAKKVIKEAGFEISEEEIESVAGGYDWKKDSSRSCGTSFEELEKKKNSIWKKLK